MKVKVASPVEGKQPGETAEVSEERGRWLISAGYATPVKEEPKKEAPPAKKKVAASKPVADD